MGKLVRRTGAEHARLNRDHGRIGRAVELPVQASFSQLAKFEGSLARKLHFHIFHFSQLELAKFEGSLARKLHFHIFHFFRF